MTTDPITPIQALLYEIQGRWWTGYVPACLSGLAGRYLAGLVRRKLARINRMRAIEAEILKRLQP